MINYTGDSIFIEEMPQGCIIAQNKNSTEGVPYHVIIETANDAKAVIESLERFIKVIEEKQNGSN